MAKGTDFGGVHSYTDLHLIQQKFEPQPAEPKLNLVDIPGADGSKDISELPAGRIVYKDRILTWIFALYPGESWHTKHRQVSNALNGKRCKITLDDDPDYYYFGRLVVREYNTDKLLRQITVEAICSPYLLKQEVTQVNRALNSTDQTIRLPNEAKPAIPTIVLSDQTTLKWKDATITLVAGTYRNPDIELQAGENTLIARLTSANTGTIKITYQEGSL